MADGPNTNPPNDEEGQEYDATVVRSRNNFYYDHFDRMTNNGRVFIEDLSSQDVFQTALTPEEVEVRTAYASTLAMLQSDYRRSDYVHPVVTTKEEVLQQRIVAPCLVATTVSSRSGRRRPRGGRMYPRHIHPWTGFRSNVENYHMMTMTMNEGDDDSFVLDPPLERIFQSSLDRAGTECGDEFEEQQSLISNLQQTLQQAGIVHSIDCFSNLVGTLDYWITSVNEGGPSIIALSKSTHNLLLPMSDADCVAVYNNASVKDSYNYQPSTEWSHARHPIGQLLYLMVKQKHHYGVLTSGTRTYFLKIQESTTPGDVTHHMVTRSQTIKRKASPAAFSEGRGDKDNIHVYISDGWSVGETNYLRAWAYMHSLPASTTNPWTNPIGWVRLAPPKSDSNNWDQMTYIAKPNGKITMAASAPNMAVYCTGEDYYAKIDNSRSMQYFYPLHQGALIYVPLKHTSLDKERETIGVGRNGACFKVKWNETEYALKQFDIGRHGDMSFVKEISAYMLLQDVWGILVPRPVFLSESFTGGIMFLGLQLGRPPNATDDVSDISNVIQRIEKEYGIRHNDAAFGRNMIIITDADGEERVAAIDFEDWDEVPIQENAIRCGFK